MNQEEVNNNLPIKILVIDDDPAIQTLLKRTLSRQGYSVSLASDGEEGLRLAKEICPAMVICDWLMPKMNGLEVCRHIKNIPELSSTFFILLTALDSVSHRVKGLDAGSDDFLGKPIEMYELQARIRSGLRLHKLNYDLQIQKQILEEELSEAAEYVTSILPEPLSNQDLKIDSRFIPSRKLGGDSFDYYWLDEQNLVIYLIDVSGHGLKSALPSLSVINLLRSRSLSKVNYYQPSNVLQRLNETFQVSAKQDKYFTMWYGVYNKKNRQLVYGNAGHPPGILFNRKTNKQVKLQSLKNNGFPIGMFSETEYEDTICQVQSNSILYIFSDGIYEVKEQNGKISGLDFFIKLLEKCFQTNNSNNLDNIIEKVKIHHGVEVFEDDLSIIEIKFV